MDHIRSKQADSIVHMDDGAEAMKAGAAGGPTPKNQNKFDEGEDECLVSIAQDERNDIIPKK